MRIVFFVASLFFFVTAEAYGYVGPGVGLGVVGVLFALLWAIVLAIVGAIWYPIKRLFGRKGKQRGPAREEQSA